MPSVFSQTKSKENLIHMAAWRHLKRRQPQNSRAEKQTFPNRVTNIAAAKANFMLAAAAAAAQHNCGLQ